MNKEQLISLIESLKLPKTEYYILSGGCLVLYGLKELTHDLDLCVSEELFNDFKERYNINENDKNEYGFYKVSDVIEIVVNNKDSFKMEYKEGYPVEKLTSILAFKKMRNAPKDQKDIENIEKHLGIR